MTLVGKAHAKINTFLAVGELRSDGYHSIGTIIQAIELHDVVKIAPSDIARVRCSDSALDGENNLVAKALRLCSEVVEVPPVEVYVEKNIPTEAGLGGGSSDVATALHLLNRKLHGALDSHILNIGIACGSDVPFFIHRHTRAHATGRGEQIQPLPASEVRQLVIAKPANTHRSTAGAYRLLDEKKSELNRNTAEFHNDFERVAPCESLELIVRMAVHGCNPVGLCGSGSAVYGFTDKSQNVAQAIHLEGYWAVATSTLTEFSDPWTL